VIKALNIAWKDLRVAFRDPAAVTLMLITPFLLTLAIGFALGGFGGNSNPGIGQIPVAVVDHDAGQLGHNLVQVMQSQDLADLLKPVVMTNDSQARSSVDHDQVSVAVIIPPDLTARLIPPGEQTFWLPAGLIPNRLPVWDARSAPRLVKPAPIDL
jgi:hypothetical protein